MIKTFKKFIILPRDRHRPPQLAWPSRDPPFCFCFCVILLVLYHSSETEMQAV
jgi:hypothetical protein